MAFNCQAEGLWGSCYSGVKTLPLPFSPLLACQVFQIILIQLNSNMKWGKQTNTFACFCLIIKSPFRNTIVPLKTSPRRRVVLHCVFGYHAKDGIWKVIEGKRQFSVRVSGIFCVPEFFRSLYLCVWCSVSLTRGVPGLHWGLWKIIFSCFATKALLHVTEETRPNGGGLGWIIQRLQSISAPLPSSRHLSGPQSLQAHHGNVDNSLYDTHSGPVATWEVVGAWIFVSLQLSKANCWIIEPLVRYFIFDWLWHGNK